MRGRHGNIFGGYLMREAFELAWLSALCFFDGHTPRFKVPPSPFFFCHLPPPSVASHVVPLPVPAPTRWAVLRRHPVPAPGARGLRAGVQLARRVRARLPHRRPGAHALFQLVYGQHLSDVCLTVRVPCVQVEAFKLNPDTQYRRKTNELIYVFRAPDTLSKVL